MTKQFQKWRLGKDGFVAVESVFAMSFFLIVLLLSLAFFTYIQPTTQIQRELHTLATIAERQGGLTDADISYFVSQVSKHDFVDERKNEIVVKAVTYPSNLDVSNVDPINSSGKNYVPRTSKEVINIYVEVPANDQLLRPLVNFFKVTELPEKYKMKESVMSERN